MKKFEYEWEEKCFLLHIQLNNPSQEAYEININRIMHNDSVNKEKITIPLNTKSHRFIVSRTSPKEEQFYIEYPKNIVLEAFYIDDRAYYPTENFYKY